MSMSDISDTARRIKSENPDAVSYTHLDVYKRQEYKDEEYTEEWAYELAYLYHKAGKADKCIDACEELILWFGDGPYVERALELRMLYQPLTKAQEEKYRRFKAEKEKPAKIKDEAEDVYKRQTP